MLKVIIFLIISTISVTTYANDKKIEEKFDGVALEKGKVAPFTGILLKRKSLIDTLLKIDKCKEDCKVKLKYVDDKCNLQKDKQKEIMKNTISSLEELNRKTTDNFNKQINKLSKITTQSDSFFNKLKSKSLWIGISTGIVTGVALSLGSYYTYKKLDN